MTTSAQLRILVIYPTPRVQIFDTLEDDARYTVDYVANVAEAGARLRDREYAAVVAVEQAELCEFFQHLHDTYQHTELPGLFVLTSADNLPALHIPCTDGYLVEGMGFNTLESYLRLRAELLEARRMQGASQTHIQRLSEELDATRRVKHELALLKHAIVRNVSHELGTPLLQVKSAVGMLNQDSVNNAQLIEYAKEATGRLESVIKNITLLGQSLDINPGPVVIRDVVEAARRNLRRAWEKSNKIEAIQVEMPPDLPPANADKQGLVTVLQLLIDNALKFGKGETVKVRAWLEGKMIMIAVEDKGIGIAQDKIDAIFDSFYQVDDTSTRHYGGAGVGLAIVKLILDYHKCEIHVSSTLGEGSTFSFQLPIAQL